MLNIDQVLTIQLNSVGQRVFSEVCSHYYQQPCNALKFTFNTSHGEFGCQLGPAIGMLYLASNTEDKRWAIHYIDTVAYGPNPGAAHTALTQLMVERSSTRAYDLNAVAFNNGQSQWTEYSQPFHVREDKRVYDNC